MGSASKIRRDNGPHTEKKKSFINKVHIEKSKYLSVIFALDSMQFPLLSLTKFEMVL